MLCYLLPKNVTPCCDRAVRYFLIYMTYNHFLLRSDYPYDKRWWQMLYGHVLFSTAVLIALILLISIHHTPHVCAKSRLYCVLVITWYASKTHGKTPNLLFL